MQRAQGRARLMESSSTFLSILGGFMDSGDSADPCSPRKHKKAQVGQLFSFVLVTVHFL